MTVDLQGMMEKGGFIPETSVSGIENDQREPREPPEPNVQNQDTGNNFSTTVFKIFWLQEVRLHHPQVSHLKSSFS